MVQTGLWGHDGAFDTLEGMVKHHLGALSSLNNYDQSQALLPSREDLDEEDFVVQDDTTRRQEIANAISTDLVAMQLTETEIARIMDF